MYTIFLSFQKKVEATRKRNFKKNYYLFYSNSYAPQNFLTRFENFDVSKACVYIKFTV